MEFDPVPYMMGQKAAGGGGGGSSSLSGLTDVDISNPTNGQTLVYNATSGKWENGAAGGGASLVMPNISITTPLTLDTATATCDMTRAAIVSAINNGAICIAKITCNMWAEGYVQFAFPLGVLEGSQNENPYVAFNTYQVLGGGDVVWFTIIVSNTEVVCFVDHTISYPQNNQ